MVAARSRLPWWLVALAVVLAVALTAVVAWSLLRPDPPVYDVTVRTPVEVGGARIEGRVTLDGRDERRWSYFDFSRNAPVETPDSLGWDLAVRRTRIIVNGGRHFAGAGGVSANSPVPTGPATASPITYVETDVTPAGDSINAAFRNWYRYDYLSHLLWPKPVTYLVRTADGRFAKLEIRSYYCPGPEPGCLTFDYAYRGDGGSTFESTP